MGSSSSMSWGGYSMPDLTFEILECEVKSVGNILWNGGVYCIRHSDETIDKVNKIISWLKNNTVDLYDIELHSTTTTYIKFMSDVDSMVFKLMWMTK